MSRTYCYIPPPPLTFSHRSGVTPYTSSCEFAGSCVFGKQSPEILSLQPIYLAKNGQALSRSYGRLFAEFLNGKLLVPLGLLALSTCVGFRYGSHTLVFPSFSRKALHKSSHGKFHTFRRRSLELSANDAKPIRHFYLFPSSLGYDRAGGLEY
ncbi:MAG: hypothetical protein G01um101420_679 [Parcubacteria group bacterium Gr01-1014_20]|nr:MAG: hypothetical protein G01um101420_679 [Parcubacteria group bacterium Gr01-1014_20]